MTIAFVTSEYITEANFAGGLSNYLYKIAQILDKRGLKPIIIVSSNCNDKIIHENIDVYRIKIKHNRIAVFLLAKILKPLFRIDLYTSFTFISQSYILNRALKKISRHEKIDLIQYSSYMATGLFRIRNIPGIVRISSLEALWRTAYKLNFDILKDLNLTVHSITDFLEIKAIKSADSVFGPSRLIGQMVGSLINKDVTIIESPYLPVEFPKDYSLYESKLKNKQYLLFYGAVGTMKGVHIIAQILNSLFLNYPDVHFVFIGKDRGYGDRLMMDFVRECAGEFSERVIYFPQLSHKELYPIIEQSIALVLPSRIDNLPNTCIEAFSLKKIVIGTRGASFEQLIMDGDNGFLCNIEDPASLYEKVKLVMGLNISQRIAIGEKAYKRLSLMEPDYIANQLIAFYKQLIS